MVRALSVEDYLEFERTSVVRHEYVDGLVIEVPGETYQHNDLVGDIYIALKPQAKALGCQIAIESLKTPTRTTRYRYPDIVVSCQAGSDERFVENPCFIAMEPLGEQVMEPRFTLCPLHLPPLSATITFRPSSGQREPLWTIPPKRCCKTTATTPCSPGRYRAPPTQS